MCQLDFITRKARSPPLFFICVGFERATSRTAFRCWLTNLVRQATIRQNPHHISVIFQENIIMLRRWGGVINRVDNESSLQVVPS